MQHLVFAQLGGKLVWDHVSLESPIHKVHCDCELVSAMRGALPTDPEVVG